MRLAHEHCVSTDRLTRELVRCGPTVGNGFLYRHFSVGEARSMDGTGRYAWKISRALETLTGRRDLQSLTMRRRTDLFDPRSRTLLRESRAWCPECLLEQVSKGAPPYDHLARQQRWDPGVTGEAAAVTTCFRESQVDEQRGVRGRLASRKLTADRSQVLDYAHHSTAAIAALYKAIPPGRVERQGSLSQLFVKRRDYFSATCEYAWSVDDPSVESAR